MRRIARLMGTAALALALAGSWTGCGRDAVDAEVTARNLSTGEVQTFSSEGDVPQGWTVCSDPTCPVPPTVPCDQLGQKVCTLNSECRLREVNCMGTGWVDSNGNSGGGTTQCDYECIPKLPLLCEELTDEKECQARPDCELSQWMCPAMACAEGQPDCGVPCKATCHQKMPAACEALDETACTARPDCEFSQWACPAMACAPGQPDCTVPCKATCHQKTPASCEALDEAGCKGRTDCAWTVVPCPMCDPMSGSTCDCKNPSCRAVTPPPPPTCPALSPLPPDFCQGGQIVPQGYDENGCLLGYGCLMPPQPPPPAPCQPQACGKNPYGMPNHTCADGTVGGPQCLPLNGACAWQIVYCPD